MGLRKNAFGVCVLSIFLCAFKCAEKQMAVQDEPLREAKRRIQTLLALPIPYSDPYIHTGYQKEYLPSFKDLGILEIIWFLDDMGFSTGWLKRFYYKLSYKNLNFRNAFVAFTTTLEIFSYYSE